LLLFAGIRWQGVEPHELSPLDMLLLVPMFLGFAAHDLQYGYVSGRGFRLTRAKAPLRYWFIVALTIAGGVFSLIVGIRELLR
jgi:hypothetical protein